MPRRIFCFGALAVVGAIAFIWWLVSGIDPDPRKVSSWRDPNLGMISSTGLSSADRTRLIHNLYLAESYTWGAGVHGSLYHRTGNTSHSFAVMKLFYDGRDALMYRALVDAGMKHDNRLVRERCASLLLSMKLLAGIPVRLSLCAEDDRYCEKYARYLRHLWDPMEWPEVVEYKFLYEHWEASKRYLYWDEQRRRYLIDEDARSAGRNTDRKVREELWGLEPNRDALMAITLPSP